MGPQLIATWDFSTVGVKAASELLLAGRGSADVVEECVRAVELDGEVPTIGYGGLPNEDGVLQLDAAIMLGNGKSGSVMALEGYRTAIGIARRIMEQSKHSILAGAGARRFAERRGFTSENDDELLAPSVKCKMAEGQNKAMLSVPSTHTDTVGTICLDESGEISVACATSGMAFKEPGRVGDSPIVGSGLYADGQVGAAAASGDGDKMIRFCPSFLTVEFMRAGFGPEDACRMTANRISKEDPSCQAALIAMDMNGNTGAACTHGGFTTVSWSPSNGTSCTRHLSPDGKMWKHTAKFKT